MLRAASAGNEDTPDLDLSSLDLGFAADEANTDNQIAIDADEESNDENFASKLEELVRIFRDQQQNCNKEIHSVFREFPSKV